MYIYQIYLAISDHEIKVYTLKKLVVPQNGWLIILKTHQNNRMIWVENPPFLETSESLKLNSWLKTNQQHVFPPKIK